MDENSLKGLPPSNGPRPHRCEVCQRSFREIATLRKHEQLHRADRPYVCNTCGKSFLWSSNLKVHERVHTGERPYKCKICHRCFTQSNDLRRHERNVHMRGKIYGYKTAGRHNSQVNLAAYQAFAMQQRALLQQALTYESYLQKAAVGSGQAQLFHHSQGIGGTGTSPLVGARPPDSATSPRSPLKLEQVNQQVRINRELEQRHMSRESNSREFDHKRENEREMSVQNGSSRDYGHDHTSSMEHQRNSLQENHNGSALYHHSQHQPLIHERVESHNTSSSHSMDENHHKSYPCDSVMDLSMNKSSNSPSSRASSTASSSIDKEASGGTMPPPKTPTSTGAESESEPGKRDVTTTSATPTVDSGGIHHCQHCNIFFYDYTMFHLHESLHMPYEDHPFRCPSCGTHCQDKIEFMFHTVWHVKYPHTIPNYTPFREGFLSSP
ncbi:unnamed protein product [Candidula unifasciata]|uniref:C2H2-type domain-containing protein n=1 Tax=Candidula unifasciata TaxID=100452 RepID=A0A8S3YWT5_9EUPU|nr:unnamed protein product [Candidula unifasciata]